MEKTKTNRPSASTNRSSSSGRNNPATDGKGAQATRSRKLTEYGRQLEEKQKVKHMYGMRERQFCRFYAEAVRSQEASGDKLLSLLESRLDNVVYRLKFATSREQARQMIVHGHITVNGSKVTSPSYLVVPTEEIALAERMRERAGFMEAVVAKRMKKAVKPPEWLELDKDGYRGRVLRNPVRADIKVAIEEHYIIELYSK